MCLLIFAHRVCPGYPLLLAANRDEFYARETAPAAFWPEHPTLLAGRDLQAGGTWMGLSRSGRFAAVTNYRDPATTAPAARSRGELPLGFLPGEESPRAYLQQLAGRAGDYAGFNLLVGAAGELWHYSNRPVQANPTRLAPGIYGLSNASLNTPWPKVELGKRRMRELVVQGQPNHNALFALVSDPHQASKEALQLQGLDTEMEQLLSAQFIQTPQYGTRSTTTVWIDDTGRASWRELGFGQDGEVLATNEFCFQVE